MLLVRNPLVTVATWVLTRALMLGALAGVVAYPDGPSILNDVKLYAEWSELLATGRFPIGDEMWQYPPGAGVVFAIADFIPPNPLVGMVVLLVLADLAILLILLLVGRRQGRWQPAWVWVVSGVLIGPIMLARFDLIPTVFAVLAVVWASKPYLSGAASSIGTLLKLWPGLMLLALPRRSLIRGGIGFVAAALVVMGAISVWSSGAVSFLGGQRDRGLQVESVGALPYLVMNVFGGHASTVFRYGSREIDMPGANTVGFVISVGGLLLIAALAVLRLIGRLEDLPAGDVALTALLVSVATSRVLSPQYAVWVAGVAAIALMDPVTRLRRSMWLLVPTAVAAQLIYPWAYDGMLHGDWFAVTLQTIRVLTLVAATIYALYVVVRSASGRALVPTMVATTNKA
ncbi:unannotated protein [freshwater metagenome]|uniref:Unannotated protein n=1 Tax=freshwater metagenome TaxID=449393 RepID=A0A6J7HQ75_9ZZZZ|nr:DUF2029 domain-containing protein [Actinomycetota bacterium]